MTLWEAWDTTDRFNGNHEVRIAAVFSNCWDGDSPFVLGTPPADSSSPGVSGGTSKTTDVQNVCFASDERDYIVYDPAVPEQNDPEISFEIVDRGPVEDLDGNPYHYHWYLYLGTTDGMYVDQGIRGSPGTVTRELGTILAAQQIERGVYPFDIKVVEEETGDSASLRHPNRLTVPAGMPFPQWGTPGYRFRGFEREAGDTFAVIDYRIEDEVDASDCYFDLLGPDLAEMASQVTLDTTVNDSNLEVRVPVPAPERTGTYAGVLCGVDANGARFVYRDARNRRMLPVVGTDAQWEAHAYAHEDFDSASTFPALYLQEISDHSFYIAFEPDYVADEVMRHVADCAVLHLAGHGWIGGGGINFGDEMLDGRAWSARAGGAYGQWRAVETGDFRSVRYVLYQGCHTGRTGEYWGNLLAESLGAGAGCATGFMDYVDRAQRGDYWSARFWLYVTSREGPEPLPITAALMQACADVTAAYGYPYGYDSHATDGWASIVPAP